MYRVHMYNTWFGDCFRLSNQNKNIIIDFGIHHKCMSGGIRVTNNNYSSGKAIFRDDVHEAIAKEIVSFDERPDLLVTHYHLDHLSGLLYMKENSSYYSPIFNKVYLPDIWNFPDSKNIIALLILEGLMEKCKLNGRGCTLLEFIKFLCASVKNVILLQREKTFDDDKFIALWPDPSYARKEANELIEELDAARELVNIADELIDIVRMVSSQEISSGKKERYLERVDFLLQHVMNIYDEASLLKLFEKEYVKLNKFGNDISIVFQNLTSSDNNMLFTGDLGSKYLSMISDNYDGRVSMHEKYKYIKIPHHGTKGAKNSHYFDFSNYEPEILMFTNGECDSPSYMISDNYQKDITSVASKGRIKVYCSNSNWCEMNVRGKFCACGCGASSTNIVFPKISREIT